MGINLKVRFKNPVFIVQVLLSILTPILAYMGLELSHLTSWAILGDAMLGAVSNPYVLGLVAVSLFNALNDPTTQGVSDSTKALGYEEPA